MPFAPKDRYYTSNHEWVTIEENLATIGITDHAQSELGDLVFIQLPEVGEEFAQGDDMVVVESVKAAADVYAVLSGEVVEVNTQLVDEPQMINQQPYDSWLVKLRIADDTDLQDLLRPEQYTDLL